jgi:putative FmdB family regulatory protein
MPIYEYEAVGESRCPTCAKRFEVVQGITARPLTKCPECGGKVKRALTAPSIHGAGSAKDRLSNKSLAEKGFTKYVKAGDGHYEKATGKGPDVIKR